ncbi:C40 family peptidase [Actinacidiphila epipremni]|uniref:Glycoside hydrolase n=1 Tax=Actinacidiphila epipremni TaxID=2053013 RepID=A0ABX0ZXZ9_9ACTN|nr:C40 family peptidase [Actinacidiphila epipremni]NJP48081.1 glycoside hydrolase [Actinacidiphila epipremni]
MATHRKSRTAILSAPGPRTAVGLTTAALATVTLFSEAASAAPQSPAAQPSIAEVKAKVDALTHDAEVATETYNGAKEKVTRQNATVNQLLTQAAQKTQDLNDSRRLLGQFAAAQYRAGGDDSTANLLLASSPQDLLDARHLTALFGKRQKAAVENYRVQQAAATQKRIEAAKSLATLTTQQAQLKAAKADVQTKLGAAQKLLNSLTAQEKARLAALEAQQEAEAKKKAAALAAQEKAKAKAAQAQQASSPSKTTTPVNASVADKAIAFARDQLGDPYVWGATGPDSWDCSGLTQAAYRAAGVTLPRTTGEQVDVGSRVSESNLQPGDLIFFYSDHSHVGIYIGGGEMIHAPHTGTVVKIAPITEMPFYGAVRPY